MAVELAVRRFVRVNRACSFFNAGNIGRVAGHKTGNKFNGKRRLGLPIRPLNVICRVVQIAELGKG